MKVKGKSIHNLSKILSCAGGKQSIRLVVPLGGLGRDYLERLGFDAEPALGDFLSPAPVGKFTFFNSNGREIIRDDLPLQPESIMVAGTTRDWHGGLHHGIQTRTIKKYPREFIAGPSEILQIIDVDGMLHVASSEMRLEEQYEIKNIHVCNMMLECFSEFEIVDSESGKIIGPTLKRLQWDILPKGTFPWDVSRPIIQRVTEKLDKKDREVIEYRMRVISRRNPDFLATGRAGFSGYFVYGFEPKGIYVLESIHLDNATYVFNSEWETLSQLTKGQIINSNLPHHRIIHNNRWSTSLARSIDGL